MSDILTLAILLASFFVVGPAVAWLTGLFNPIGFVGTLPWRVPESARAADRENRIWTPEYHEAWTERQR